MNKNLENEKEIRLLEEEKQRLNVRFVIYCGAFFVLFGAFYQLLGYFDVQKYAWIGFVVGVCGALYFIIKLILDTKKIKKLEESDQNQLQAEDNIRQEIQKLNVEKMKLILFIICLNEHFYELSSIQDTEERKACWLKKNYLWIEAIQRKYGYHATIEEYEEYFEEWKSKKIHNDYIKS